MLNGTFKFSSVMIRLNLSLRRVHATKLINHKYANTFLSFSVDIEIFFEDQGTRNIWSNCHIQLSIK